MDERGLSIVHTTIMRWIHEYAPKIDKRTPMKRLINPGLGFWSFNTVRKTIRGYEIVRMIKKGQAPSAGNSAAAQAKFINSLFGIAA